MGNGIRRNGSIGILQFDSDGWYSGGGMISGKDDSSMMSCRPHIQIKSHSCIHHIVTITSKSKKPSMKVGYPTHPAKKHSVDF
jgi:hypothetical protein